MSELPIHWQTVPLGDLAEFLNGAAFKPDDWGDEGVPIIRIQNLTDPEKPFNRTTRAVSENLLIQNGDILVSWSATLDAFIWERGEAWLNQHIFRVLPREDLVDRRYLFYILKQEIEKLIKSEHLHGSTMKHINRGPFLSHKVSLPPLPEQRRIVAKLDSLFAKSRRARQELSHIPRLVEHYKQAILAKAFSGDLTADWRSANIEKITVNTFLNEQRPKMQKIIANHVLGRDERSAFLEVDADFIRDKAERNATEPLPDTWVWAGIGEFFGVFVGATPSRKQSSYWEGTLPWVSSGEVAFCRIQETKEMITQEGLDASSTRIHPPGTVLLGMIGEGKTRGQAAILDIFACNNQNSAAIRVAEANYPPEYLYWYLYATYEATRTSGAGNNQPALNKSRVQRLLFPLAPPAEAALIVNAIEASFSDIDRMIKNTTPATALLDRLDQATLAKAFRGELVTQETAEPPPAPPARPEIYQTTFAL